MSFGKETYGLSSGKNNEVVKQLYEVYAKKLLAYTCKNYSIDKDDAWAVVYKTIYKIAEVGKNYRFENEQKRSGFIFRTHINFLKNYFRDDKSFEKNNQEVDLTEHFTEKEPEIHSDQNLPLTILQQELEKLEDWQRILLLMRGQDIPYGKIAEFVKKPENQLKVYYARLKKQLADDVNAGLQKIKTTPHVNQ
jgi:DNA-directed RNA polymerase specialized sigma24 family protein